MVSHIGAVQYFGKGGTEKNFKPLNCDMLRVTGAAYAMKYVFDRCFSRSIGRIISISSGMTTNRGICDSAPKKPI